MILGTLPRLSLFPVVLLGEFWFVAYYVGFIPIRLLEWWIVILIFYDRQL
jgi:hypothetical protein